MERAARAQGLSLSAWLREAARKRLEAAAPPALATATELQEFFSRCDGRESGGEPDWEAHLQVIEASKTRGVHDL